MSVLWGNITFVAEQWLISDMYELNHHLKYSVLSILKKNLINWLCSIFVDIVITMVFLSCFTFCYLQIRFYHIVFVYGDSVNEVSHCSTNWASVAHALSPFSQVVASL